MHYFYTRDILSKKIGRDCLMSDLVVKTNWLNQALQTLTLMEIRIIQLAIIDARESGAGLSADKPLKISAKRYAEAFGVQAKNAYAKIKQSEETLFKRQFTYTDPQNGRTVKSRWLQDVTYLDDQGSIELCFTRTVVKGISRIDGAIDFFTKYLLSNTIHFKSVYSVRLYELLNQWKNGDPKKMPMFEVFKLRAQLGVDVKEYQVMADFKKRVLDKALKEINDYSDLHIEYRQVKKGRNIIGFYFDIKEKKDHKQKQLLKLSDKQRAMYSDKLSRLDELSYLCEPGTSYDDFAKDIEEQLKRPERVEFYRPYLIQLGFKH